MDGLRIREARDEDLDGLLEVYHSAYRENRELGFPAKAETATIDDLRAWMDGGRLVVAVADGSVVGAARVEATGPSRAKISRIGVHEDWQEKDIGSSLLAHLEALAADEGHDVAWLTTPADHPYLPEFYGERGYEATEPYPLDYRDYDEVVMEKRLDQIET